MNTTNTAILTGSISWPDTTPPQTYTNYIPPDPINRRALMVQFAAVALEGLLAREGSHIHKDSELVEQAWNIAKMMIDEGNNKHQISAW